MAQRYETQVDTASPWKQFQGQIVAGAFPLQEYLGGSDHSAVFLTHSNSPEPAKAAIKLVLDNTEKRTLQLSRWELAESLSHPHLLRIFHSGRVRLGDTNLLYAVMEYADEDLSQILPQRALTGEEVQQMLPPVLDALAYVHSKGFAHGRIKPSNIVACGDHVKLSSDTICETGEPVTVPDAHDAPESTASVAGDIWSLGTTIVEVLTQRLPQSGSDPMGLEIPQTIPAPFSDIAYGCLRLDPNRRWKLAEVASRLQPEAAAPLQPEATAKKKTSAVKRESRPLPPKPAPKRSYAAPAVGIGLLLIVLVAGPIFLRHHMENRQAPVSQSSEKSPETAATEPLPTIQSPSKLEKSAPAATEQLPPSNLEKFKAQVQAEKSTPEDTASKSAVGTVNSAPSAALPNSVSRPAPDASPQSGVLHEMVPVVSDKARDTIRGTVRVNVKVAVDTSGGVQHAELATAGPSKYFANLALGAAEKFEFEPAAGGDGSSRKWILRFEFTNAGTNVFSARANP